jgi:hypothetical protein
MPVTLFNFFKAPSNFLVNNMAISEIARRNYGEIVKKKP